MEKKKNLQPGLLLAICFLLSACSHRPTDSSVEANAETGTEAPSQDEKDKKIDALNTSLSRSQLRIEELDAKLTALTDKVESLKITLDNIAGLKPVQTEVVGSKKPEHDEREHEHGAATHHSASAPVQSSEPQSSHNALPLKLEPSVHEFTSALKLFKAGKYTDAELAFNQFTEKNPEHVLAGSAQFYAGESYFMMKEYKLALAEYSKVVSSFANSPRAASALVRMAHCYDLMGNKTEAEKTKALARDLYYGNPALELDAPSETATGDKSKEENSKHDALKAMPIEPVVELTDI